VAAGDRIIQVSGGVHYSDVSLKIVSILAAVVISTSLGGLLIGALVSRTAPGGDDRPAGPPLTVAADVLDEVCLGNWATKKSPSDLEPHLPSSESTWPEWAPVADGVPVAPAQVQLTVQGTGEAEVVLTGLEVRVVDRRAPMTGTMLNRGCGDIADYRLLYVDLDKRPPTYTSENLYQEPTEGVPDWAVKPLQFPYHVSLSDAETFVIVASTSACDCDWVVDLSWASEGNTGKIAIDNHGMPFRTVSSTGLRPCDLTYSEVGGEVINCS
jgi:hypothetical protein